MIRRYYLDFGKLIPDLLTNHKTLPVLKYVKLLAAQQGSSLRRVIEDALRDFLSRSRMESEAIKLETFSGNGLKPGVDLDNASSLHEIMDGR